MIKPGWDYSEAVGYGPATTVHGLCLHMLL